MPRLASCDERDDAMASVRERGFAAMNLVGLAICMAAYLLLARAHLYMPSISAPLFCEPVLYSSQ